MLVHTRDIILEKANLLLQERSFDWPCWAIKRQDDGSNHTRLTELLLTRCLLCLARLYVHTFSLQNVLAFSRELYRDRLYMCILILVCPFFPYACWFWFTWIVFDVIVSVCLCRVQLGSCWVILIYLFHAHDLCSCSFCLLFFMKKGIQYSAFTLAKFYCFAHVSQSSK